MYFEIITSQLAESGNDNELLITESPIIPFQEGIVPTTAMPEWILKNTEGPCSKTQLKPSSQESHRFLWLLEGLWGHQEMYKWLHISLAWSPISQYGGDLGRQCAGQVAETSIGSLFWTHITLQPVSPSHGVVVYIQTIPIAMQREPWTWHPVTEGILALNPSSNDITLKSSAFLLPKPSNKWQQVWISPNKDTTAHPTHHQRLNTPKGRRM